MEKLPIGKTAKIKQGAFLGMEGRINWVDEELAELLVWVRSEKKFQGIKVMIADLEIAEPQ